MGLIKWIRKKSIKQQVKVQLNMSLPKKLDKGTFKADMTEVLSNYGEFFFKVNKILKDKNMSEEQKSLLIMSVTAMFDDTMNTIKNHVEPEETEDTKRPTYIG